MKKVFGIAICTLLVMFSTLGCGRKEVVPESVENNTRVSTSTVSEQQIEEVQEEELPYPTEYNFSQVIEDDLTEVSAVSCDVNDNGHLVLTLENGKTKDLGAIGATDKQKGYVVAYVDCDNTLLKAEFLKKGELLSAPRTPTRDGYVFMWWDGIDEKVTGNTVVTARYARKGDYHLVTFMDCEDILCVEAVPNGGNAYGPSEIPEHGEMIFAGWDYSLANVTDSIIRNAKYCDGKSPLIEIQSQAIDAETGEFEVVLRLKNNPGICSFNLNVLFDGGLDLTGFKFNEEALGGISTGPETIPAVGAAVFSWVKHDADITEDLDLLTLNFSLNENALPGVYTISASYDPDNVFNLSEDNVTLEIVNSMLKIA